MAYYPIMIDLTGKSCLVVGGGEVAARKVASLVEAGARVRVIAPEIDSRIVSSDAVELEHRPFEPGDTNGFVIVFAATDDRELNRRVSEEASSRGVPVNVVDDPELCSFIVPSVVRRGDLVIAISTSGKSPALSRRIRQELEDTYGPRYGDLVDLMGEMRELVKAAYSTQPERVRAFRKMLDGGIVELVQAGKVQEARERARQCI